MNKTDKVLKTIQPDELVSGNRPQQGTWLSRRWPIIVACLLSVAWCLAYGLLRSRWNNQWVQQNGGGVPYTVFWILFAGIFWPSKRLAVRICVLAVLVICGLEFFQLYNPEPLATFRRSRFGAALLGSTFVWADIPPYFIGGLIGWPLLKVLGSREGECPTAAKNLGG